MDLRPKLADEFITAILADIRDHGFADETVLRERWRPLIVERFVSQSVPLPPGHYVSTYDRDVVDAFLGKYPETESVVEYVRFALREIWPDVRILLSVFSNPESCHTCWEGQHLNVEYYSKIADAEYDAYDAAHDTRDWTWSPKAHRERKLHELLFENGLYAESRQDIRDLVRLARGYGDPDELLAAEIEFTVEWENRRRERAADRKS